MRLKTKQINMTEGSIGGKTLRFALPLAATGILQQLFNAADIAVVGRFVGKNAMAAVGSNAPLVNLILSLFIGISIGANVVIASYTGQKNDKAVGRAVHTALTVAFISGVLLALICEALALPILRLMKIPDNVFDMSVLYFRVYLTGMPVILLYDFASAIFRSRGDTATPLICLTVSGAINVGLNLFFVLVVGMTVDGVALATVISNLISSALLIFFLAREQGAVHFTFKKLGVDKRIFIQMISIGIPAGIQGMVFSLSNLILQSAVNSLGENVMAGSSAAFNIEIFCYYVINAFGQACTTFIGQNYGARKPDRCRRVLKITLLQDLVFTVAIAVVILLSGKYLLHIFNSDPDVIAVGRVRLKYILTAEFINVIIEILSGYMRGFGFSFVPAVVCMAGICGVRLTWLYAVFMQHKSFGTLMMAYPVSWTVTALALCFAAVYVDRKKLRSFYNKEKS
ncbi:MATE family efflux transporter [Ruminococcus sp. NK3A76]|uniref:MATE family efflux transporter n=1 Tax=Ruminococcus sp. NK3A76 TaxID=877411 RepID=UPI00048BFFFA|nr:MATE family efflux transporter [Ruminococcus sp. NK3A76]